MPVHWPNDANSARRTVNLLQPRCTPKMLAALAAQYVAGVLRCPRVSIDYAQGIVCSCDVFGEAADRNSIDTGFGDSPDGLRVDSA